MTLEAHICRRYYPKQTKGELTITDIESGEVVFECLTLELPDRGNKQNVSCINQGVYNVVPRTSNKYGNHLHITNVEGRGWILIHWGNFAGSDNPKSGHPDIRGCVLVGSGYVDLDGDAIDEITNSKNTFKNLMKVAPNGFKITIEQ